MSPTARLYAAVLLIGAWLGLLLFGLVLQGVVHLVLALALVLVPWRALLSPEPVDGLASHKLSDEGAAPAPRAADGGDARSSGGS